jgi:predicted HTH transcriptional regulator
MTFTYNDLRDSVAQWEGPRLEFKEGLTRQVISGLPSDLASFANSEGGRIIFGVTEAREMVGCKLTSKERNTVSQMAKNCRPPVSIDFEEVEGEGKTFSLILVGQSKVVHCDDTRRFPARIGSTKDHLDTLGLVTLMRARLVTTETVNEQQRTASPEKRQELTPREVAMYLKGLSGEDEKTKSALISGVHTNPL